METMKVNGKNRLEHAAVPEGRSIRIVVPAIEVRKMILTVEGISPLIVHRFGEKARKMMAQKQGGEAGNRKEKRTPALIREEFEDCKHKLPNGKDAFPAVAFKAAALQATSLCEGVNKVEIGTSLHIDADLIPLQYKSCTMRTDAVRLASGVANLTYRPEYTGWKATLPISYNSNVITPEQIVHLFNLGGFGVGIGELRPLSKERRTSGTNGRFKVVSTQQVKA